MTVERSGTPRRPQRVQPVSDLTERLSLRRAIPLVGIEFLGLAVLFGMYAALNATASVLAPLLVPPVVSFVLVVANSSTPAARPLRVMAAYLIAGIVGLGIAALPGPLLPEAVLAGTATMLIMHLTGALHSPAIAVAIIAVLADFSARQAAAALPLLVVLAAVVVALAWAAHALLGDEKYPTDWF